MSSKQSDTLQTITLHCTMQSLQRYFVMDKVHKCLPSTDAGSERTTETDQTMAAQEYLDCLQQREERDLAGFHR